MQHDLRRLVWDEFTRTLKVPGPHLSTLKYKPYNRDRFRAKREKPNPKPQTPNPKPQTPKETRTHRRLVRILKARSTARGKREALSVLPLTQHPSPLLQNNPYSTTHYPGMAAFGPASEAPRECDAAGGAAHAGPTPAQRLVQSR